jgi:hypothetical protein
MARRIHITEATKLFIIGTDLYKMLLTSVEWPLEPLTLPSVQMFASGLSEALAAVRSAEPSSSQLVRGLV